MGVQIEKEKLNRMMEKAKKEIAHKNADLSKTEDALVRAEKSKAQQQARIEELTKNERNLLMELEKLRMKKGGKPGQSNGSVSPTRLNQMLKSIEQERDHYKKENEKLKRKTQKLAEVERSSSPTRAAN